MFGLEHLVWLGVFVAACVIMSLLYRRANQTVRHKMRIVLGFLTIGLQIWRIVFQTLGGTIALEHLPLHLCDITIFLTLLHALRGGKLVGEYLYCLGMPGALAAMLFPDWLRYPILNIQSLQSFSTHICMAAYAVMLVAGGDIRPQAKRLPKCLAIAIAFCVPIYFINKLLNTNFFFLNWPSAGSPLEPFEALCGNPGYIFGYFPLVVVLWLILYLPIELKRIVKRKHSLPKITK